MRLPASRRRTAPRAGRRATAYALWAPAFALACIASPGAARAHVGPPYPVLVDRPAAGYLVSVWADPDVGTGTFYVLLEDSDGAQPKTAPSDLSVEVWVQPTSERLPRVSYPARLQPELPRIQYVAKPAFDRQERWDVGVVLRGGGRVAKLATEVEATPDGLGPWSLPIFLLPFLAFGGLWSAALLRRARLVREAQAGGRAEGEAA